MNLAWLSLRRPIFITSVVVLILTLGIFAIRSMPVDLFPDVTFPVVMVTTPYPGAGPEEVETLVSTVLEEQLSTLPGLDTLRSMSLEGASTVIAEFTLETDIREAEQRVRDQLGSARGELPPDIEEPVIRRIDPADQPIMIIAISADLGPADLFELADDVIKPRLEQVNQVGLVEIVGGREREIRIELDRNLLDAYEISATQVANAITTAGQNIPAGSVTRSETETVFRTLGEFEDVQQIGNSVVTFFGNEVPVIVNQLGEVVDSLADEESRAFVNDEQAVFLTVYRQSGANTIAVVDQVTERITELNQTIAERPGSPSLAIVRDESRMIRANVFDVVETISIGILLTVVVVYFFLGSGRSTFITGLALPNSLIGAFALMSLSGFSINIMTLLALSLAVGLLIDDAIVVRENIFRHNEMGKDPARAALEGTREVTLAVIAVTMAVVSVFAPIAFITGIVGQFFREFGLTICFAMAISLFDALTIAPMLSAYFAGGTHGVANSRKSLWGRTVGRAVRAFDRFQSWLEHIYEKSLNVVIRHPAFTLVAAFFVFVGSLMLIALLPKTFLPPQDLGEFQVSLELPPGSSLPATSDLAREISSKLRSNPVVDRVVTVAGGRQGESNVATLYVDMIPPDGREVNTTEFKDEVREMLQPYAYARPLVMDVSSFGGDQRPFNLNIAGSDMKEIRSVAGQVYERLKDHPGLTDVELDYREGQPEFQVVPDLNLARRLGVSTAVMGQELRTQIEGTVAGVFRERGQEFDIRVRLKEDQRNLEEAFNDTFVPNINQRLIYIRNLAEPVTTTGPSVINRQDRSRIIQITADVAPGGQGLGSVITDINELFQSGELKLPDGVTYSFEGEAEEFQNLVQSMITAGGLAILFIYFVLASLYESFMMPFTIMIGLPLAFTGALFALWITGSSLDLFSMIGCIMLLGLASKNSILLVDYMNQLANAGHDMKSSIINAGKVRLRPILMTSFALIAGMAPVAIGLNEASAQRTSMGISVIGGLVSSTLLTLLVVPAAYIYIERIRRFSGIFLKKFFLPKDAIVAKTKPTPPEPGMEPEIDY